MWVAEYRASCLKENLIQVVPKVFRKRNQDITEWSLVAKTDIPLGTFIGFYSGEFATDVRESLYSAKVDSTHIYPFPDEERITALQRTQRPLANMNEPAKGSYANCCMLVQDFSTQEVVHSSPDVRFYRGLACFTCTDIKANEELTWHYGASYQSHRDEQDYEVGYNCKLLTQKKVFIPDHSQGVLSVMPKISLDCVFPVQGLRKSERFPLEKKRKRKKNTSSEDSDSSSSGSGHIQKYKPSAESRQSRLTRRTAQK